MVKNCKYLFFFTALFVCLFPLAAQDFQYKHQEGDKYRIISTVNEDVYIDRKLNHRAEILNRIAVEVVSVSEGKGMHKAVFQTSERGVMAAGASNAGRSFQWAREYDSEFERDSLGRITIDKKYYMPVVRDVPVFTGREISPGGKWSYEGHEVHDFRESFGIQEPYRIPFTANYVFLGERSRKGKSYPAFSVNYRINLTQKELTPRATGGRIWPVKITGESAQTVYWDSAMGQPVAYDENFRYIFELSNGRVFEYRGKAEAEVVESTRMDKEKIAGDIADEIRRLDIPEVSVRVVDEGITISLDDIQFHPDSAAMLPGESGKLDKIVDILRRYQERDIMVGGHTALAGTEEGRRKLSADRASVVADYLIEKKARPPDRVVVRGFGSDRPVADNGTEEGRRKNRRVEITILEN
jgi:outer membrane protein OmpA-like peptidoglycan-associated protein